jgi:hypothetical protein
LQCFHKALASDPPAELPANLTLLLSSEFGSGQWAGQPPLALADLHMRMVHLLLARLCGDASAKGARLLSSPAVAGSTAAPRPVAPAIAFGLLHTLHLLAIYNPTLTMAIGEVAKHRLDEVTLQTLGQSLAGEANVNWHEVVSAYVFLLQVGLLRLVPEQLLKHCLGGLEDPCNCALVQCAVHLDSPQGLRSRLTRSTTGARLKLLARAWSCQECIRLMTGNNLQPGGPRFFPSAWPGYAARHARRTAVCRASHAGAGPGATDATPSAVDLPWGPERLLREAKTWCHRLLRPLALIAAEGPRPETASVPPGLALLLWAYTFDAAHQARSGGPLPLHGVLLKVTPTASWIHVQERPSGAAAGGGAAADEGHSGLEAKLPLVRLLVEGLQAAPWPAPPEPEAADQRLWVWRASCDLSTAVSNLTPDTQLLFCFSQQGAERLCVSALCVSSAVSLMEAVQLEA